MARFSPIMRAVEKFAAAGDLSSALQRLRCCSGRSVPGAMLRNRDLKFHCEHVHIRVEQIDTPFTRTCRRDQVLRIPIAHGEGNYFADPGVIARLEANRQVVFRYTDGLGRVTDEANPNGSAAAIAGLCNESRNVVGLMPHPERACESMLGSTDGRVIFESVVESLARGSNLAAASVSNA
jgi:phosphoribosylformylglycinamidine synthase